MKKLNPIIKHLKKEHPYYPKYNNKENKELHEDLVSTMKDLGGCKVTIKYMDKEIIGRIQQLQLMQQGLDKHPNTLTWNTIEAEISLNRHKVGASFCNSVDKVFSKL